MKKTLLRTVLIALCCMMVFALTACNTDTDTTTTTPPGTVSKPSTPPESKPAATTIVFDIDNGQGTLAAPYTMALRAGQTQIVDYTVTPEASAQLELSFAYGTITDGTFTQSDRGVVANAADGSVTIKAADDAALGATAIQVTVGDASAYILLDVNNLSGLTQWSRAEFLSNWYIAEGAYNADNVDALELVAGQSMSNGFEITEEKSALYLAVQYASVSVSVDGTPIAPIVIPETTTAKLVPLVYDLSSYIGSKVTVTIANTAENNGVIAGAQLFAIDNVTSDRTAWTKQEIIDDWSWQHTASDYRSGVGEGFDLNTNDSWGYQYIYNTIRVTEETSKLQINVRRFGQDEGRISKALLVVNGEKLIPISFDAPVVDIYDLDNKPTWLLYDLSAYIGQDVRVVFALTSEPMGHLVIQEMKLSKMDTSVSDKTSWNFGNASSDWEDWSHEINNQENPFGEGYNVNTNANGLARAFLYNYVTIPSDNTTFVVRWRRGFGESADNVAKILLLVNDTVVPAIGQPNTGSLIANTDGPETYLVYDLSAYAGQTVRLVMASVEYGIDRLVVIDANFRAALDTTVSDKTSWNLNNTSSDWEDWGHEVNNQEGPFNEGYNLNTKVTNLAQAFIYNYVNVPADNTTFVVNFRRFHADNDRTAYVTVLVDGNPLIPMGYTVSVIPVEDTDGPKTQLVYDLSAYAGKNVRIDIVSTEAQIDRLVVMDAAFKAPEVKDASTLTSWNKDSIKSDWVLTYASTFRDNVGEGFDFNTNDANGNEFIYNYLNITAENCVFTMQLRRFGQDNGKANAVGVLVNGKLLVPTGYSYGGVEQSPEQIAGLLAAAQGYVPVPDGDNIKTNLTYDLSEYIGQTVQIVIIQPVAKTGHLVIEQASLIAHA